MNTSNTKITKSDYISKSKNRTIKIIDAKKLASGQLQSSLHIWPLLKKVEFLGAQNAPFGRPWCPNAIRYNMRFFAHHFCSSLRIFYVNMATSEWRGLHIRSWDRATWRNVHSSRWQQIALFVNTPILATLAELDFTFLSLNEKEFEILYRQLFFPSDNESNEIMFGS